MDQEPADFRAWLTFVIDCARTVPDALDPKAASILENVRDKYDAYLTALSQPLAVDTRQSGEAERLREELGDPQEWADKLAELYEWTGSAWLAGETKEQPDGLQTFLCSLIGYLLCGRDAAQMALATTPAPSVSPECTSSPDGKHQVDTSMESGPNNCFFCEEPMGGEHVL